MNWLALDIGGANLKAAHASGGVRSLPFALWKEPENLANALRSLVKTLPRFDRLAVTMTGELCDCFATKSDGVASILSSVRAAFPDYRVDVWGTDERFHSASFAVENVMLVAASNWMALATKAAKLTRHGMLIDIGSTTSDLIPIRDFRPVPAGRTDTDRLRTGELVYAGGRRTPICALATSLRFRGASINLAAELFATTWDVYLTLGDLNESPHDVSTADGRPATREFARDRLARMIGADRDGFSQDDAIHFAAEADSVLVNRLVENARTVAGRSLGEAPGSVVVSGSGEFLARRVAEQVVAAEGEIISLSHRWGKAESDAACAYALMLLACEREEVR